MHQIHIVLLERDWKKVKPDKQQFLDIVQVPFWTGSGPLPQRKGSNGFFAASTGILVYPA